jgi:hypothetical protein
MNIVSASSNNVARFVQRMAKSSSISIERQHYQVIENRIEPTRNDKIYIQRIDVNTGDNRQESIYSPNLEGQISCGEYQIYQQEVPSYGYYGRFIYCIDMNATRDNVKTVCILVLNQITEEGELDGLPIFNYGAGMFYINMPLQKATNGQLEVLSDTEFKNYIIQATTEWKWFQNFVKTVPFNSGRLWEMPIQFAGHDMVYLSIHEPLSKPSVLNIVLQKFDGISVSHILYIGSTTD